MANENEYENVFEDEEEIVGLDTEKRDRGYFMSRSWSYDTNNKDSDMYGISEVEWKDKIMKEYGDLCDAGSIDWLTYIFHDRDKPSTDPKENAKQVVNSNGLVALHLHAVVRYKNGKTQSAASKDFLNGNQRSQNCKYIDNRLGGFRNANLYLTHHTQSAYNEGKEWYAKEEVITFNCDYTELIKTRGAGKRDSNAIKEDLEILLKEIMEGKMRVEDAKAVFRLRHGATAFIDNLSRFDNAWQQYIEIVSKEHVLMSENGDFTRETTYIQGSAGTGKTVLATQLNYVRYGSLNSFGIAGGNSEAVTFDLVGGYNMEKGAVASDLSPLVLPNSSLKQLLEVGTFTLTQSRNTVKGFYAKHINIANALPLYDFMVQNISKALFDTNHMMNRLPNHRSVMSEIRQLLRRIKNNLIYGHDESDNAVIHVYRLKDVLPDEEDLYQDFMINGSINGVDERVLEYFYDYVGHIKYDSVFVDNKQFVVERRKLAEKILKVLDGEEKVDGFTKAEDIIQLVL